MTSSSLPPPILQGATQNRVVFSYAVAPDHIAPLLPDSLVPRTRDGKAYVSLVGVELTGVRVLGLAGPGIRRVPAVELRVHVRPTQSGPDASGTWTAQAHVSRRLAAWGARYLYHEPVEVTSMQPVRREPMGHVEMTYRFDWKGREQRLRVRGERPPAMPAPDAPALSLLRPHLRYTTTRNGALLRAHIERPAAPIHRVQEHHVTIQWTDVYGKIGRLLSAQDPALVLLSPGAPVTLRWREWV